MKSLRKRLQAAAERARNREARVRTRHASTCEILEGRWMLAGDTPAIVAPYQNPLNPLDVNGDHRVTNKDALLIVNDLLAHGSHQLSPTAKPLIATAAGGSNNYLDVTGDNLVSPKDVLRVFNLLDVPKQMQIHTFATDLTGNPITQITVGTQFRVTTVVTDIRSPVSATPGVFASYANIGYDSTLTTIDSGATVTFDPFFDLSRTSNLTTAGTIGQIGAATTTLTPPGAAPQNIWYVVATASAAGTQTFTPSFDNTVSHENLVYGNDQTITADEIDFVGDALQINPTPSLSIANAIVPEGNSGTTNMVFTVSLSQASSLPVSVVALTTDPPSGDIATAGTDYQSTTQTLTFAPGATTALLTVAVQGDTTVEPDEIFQVVLNTPSNATIGTGIATGTIVNDDSATITAPDITVNNATSGTVDAVFTVSLSNDSATPVTVQFATADGTAQAGSDYTATSGTLTFAAGTTSTTVTVAVLGNPNPALVETFQLNLTNPTGATVPVDHATATINPAVVMPQLTIGDVSLAEGNSGDTSFVFTASLSVASTTPVVVTYATADGTATVADQDYVATSGTLTFAAGELTQLITVQVVGDTHVESDETFNVNLSVVSGTVANPTASGVGTILNDDTSITVPDITVTNVTSGTTDAVFTVSLSASSTLPVTVQFATGDITAHAGTDYTATNGTVTFAPGSTTSTITVSVLGNPNPANAETFRLNLANPINAVLSVDHAIATINPAVTIPQLSINDVTAPEGNSGTSNFVFTVSLAAASTLPVTVQFNTVNGTATAGSDYAATSGTLTFAPGTTSQLITVVVNGDTIDEPDETFQVVLSGANGALLPAAPATGTIVNDDTAPPISIANATGAEGTDLLFTVSLGQASGRVVTVAYTTADAPSGNKATANLDYLPVSGTLTFLPGVTQRTISVHAVLDVVNETDEVFQVVLSNPVNTTLGTATATGTITNVTPADAFVQVPGDADYDYQDDQFVVSRDADSHQNIVVTRNGVVFGTYSINVLQQLIILGKNGNDRLTVDSSNGLINIPNGIRFDGGDGYDSVRVIQTGGDTQVSDAYSVGPALGMGSSKITGPSGTQTVYFQNLEPFLDLVPATTLTVNGTNADNAISYRGGDVDPAANGLVAVDNQETIEFSNKDNLAIVALAGSDTISINNPSVPVGATAGGLKTISVAANDPTGSDTLIVNNVPGAQDKVVLEPTAAGAGNLVYTAAPSVAFVGVEHLTLVGQLAEQDTFGIDGTAGNDTWTYAITSADAGTVTGLMNAGGIGSFPLVPVTFSNMSPTTAREFNNGTQPGGTDVLVVRGTSGDDTFDIAELGAAVARVNVSGSPFGPAGIVSVTAAQSLTIDAQGGSDTFNYTVTAANPNGPAINLLGGDSGSAGDRLNFNPLLATLTQIDLGLHTILSAGGAPVNFVGLEGVNVNGIGGTLTVLGTANDDAITYTPTAANAGNFVWNGLSTLFSFTGLGGPFTIVGGTASGDQVTVQGTNGQDQITINAGARTVTVNALQAVTLDSTIERLNVLGLAGDDTFIVNPAAGVSPPANNLNNLVISVDGGDSQTADALVVNAAGGGPLAANQFVVVQRSNVANTGTVRVYANAVAWPSINYRGIETVSPNVAGDTTAPNLLILGPDQYESNETLATAAFLGAAPNLSIQHAAIYPHDAANPPTPADQDYYRVVATQNGTLDIQVAYRLFTGLLPADGNIAVQVLDLAGNLIATSLGTAIAGVPGAARIARIQIPVTAGQSYIYRVYGANADGTANGTVVNGYDATIINSPAAEQITGVEITNKPTFDLLGVKANSGAQGATPLVNSLTIHIKSTAVSSATTFNGAISSGSVQIPRTIVLKGDSNGIIPIASITSANDPSVPGQSPSATIVLTFARPLHDDRYTLTVNDAAIDLGGGPYSTRFTVDSVPELAVYSNTSVAADLNGNGFWDLGNADAANRDTSFQFGANTDQRFAGKLGVNLPGYDVLATYGRVNGTYQFSIDRNGNGRIDDGETIVSPAQVSALAVAGNFDGDASNGDEIALFDGTNWRILSHDLGSVVSTFDAGLRGYPLAGDFDGDGKVDLATYQNDQFFFNFGSNGFGNGSEQTISFGAPGVLDRPVAADMDGDGITDIGLWVPYSASNGTSLAEWRFLVSNDFPDATGKTLRQTGNASTLNHGFMSAPLGTDLLFHFGTPNGLPLVGNFDPPISAQPHAVAAVQTDDPSASPTIATPQAATASTPAATSLLATAPASGLTSGSPSSSLLPLDQVYAQWSDPTADDDALAADSSNDSEDDLAELLAELAVGQAV